MRKTQSSFPVEVLRMKRQPFEIAGSVFAFSVATEQLCVRMLRDSLAEWLGHPPRLLLFSQ